MKSRVAETQSSSFKYQLPFNCEPIEKTTPHEHFVGDWVYSWGRPFNELSDIRQKFFVVSVLLYDKIFVAYQISITKGGPPLPYYFFEEELSNARISCPA